MDRSDLLKALHLETFIALDFETTGLEVEVDRVMEVAAILFKDGDYIMRTGFRTFIAGSLLFFLTSCMYLSSEYRDVQVPPDSFKGGVVILPFSDYTPYTTYASYWRRSLLCYKSAYASNK